MLDNMLDTRFREWYPQFRPDSYGNRCRFRDVRIPFCYHTSVNWTAALFLRPNRRAQIAMCVLNHSSMSWGFSEK
jgi:hypothetical protein